VAPMPVGPKCNGIVGGEMPCFRRSYFRFADKDEAAGAADAIAW
jgi:hypothetical protein